MVVKDFLKKAGYDRYKVKNIKDVDLYNKILTKDEVIAMHKKDTLNRIGCEFKVNADEKEICVLYLNKE